MRRPATPVPAERSAVTKRPTGPLVAEDCSPWAAASGSAARPAAAAAAPRAAASMPRSLVMIVSPSGEFRRLPALRGRPSPFARGRSGRPRPGCCEAAFVDLAKVRLAYRSSSAGADILFQSVQLGRAGDWDDVRPLREQPGKRHLRGGCPLLARDPLQADRRTPGSFRSPRAGSAACGRTEVRRLGILADRSGAGSPLPRRAVAGRTRCRARRRRQVMPLVSGARHHSEYSF